MNGQLKNEKQSIKKPLLLTLAALFSSVLSVLVLEGAFSLIFTIFSAGALAGAMLISGSYFFLLIAPITYIVAYALSADLIVAFASVAYIPVAVVTVLAYTGKKSMVGIICRTSAALAVFQIIVFSMSFISVHGSLSQETFLPFISETHTFIADTVYEMLILPLGLQTVFTYEVLGGFITFAFILLPSVLITVFNIAAFCITALVRLFCFKTSCKYPIAPESKSFAISRMAAVLFIVSYLIMVFAGTEFVSAFSAVAMNLVIIFTPGLALFGAIDFIRQPNNTSQKRTFTIVAMIFLFFMIPALFFILTAFSGAWATFRNKDQTKTNGGNYAP